MEESSSASTDVSGETNSKHHLWTEEHEKILIEWADKAMCYSGNTL